MATKKSRGGWGAGRAVLDTGEEAQEILVVGAGCEDPISSALGTVMLSQGRPDTVEGVRSSAASDGRYLAREFVHQLVDVAEFSQCRPALVFSFP